MTFKKIGFGQSKIEGSKISNKTQPKISEMDRKPTFSGKIKDKDQEDISYWHLKRQLQNDWRNHGDYIV